jgi:hypothetical protein
VGREPVISAVQNASALPAAAQPSNRAIVKQKRVTWNLRFSKFSYISLEIATDRRGVAAAIVLILGHQNFVDRNILLPGSQI